MEDSDKTIKVARAIATQIDMAINDYVSDNDIICQDWERRHPDDVIVAEIKSYALAWLLKRWDYKATVLNEDLIRIAVEAIKAIEE